MNSTTAITSTPNNYSNNTLQDDESTTAAGTDGTAPASSGALYYQAGVITIGIIGMLANGIVLLVLVVSKQLKKQIMNIPLINQMTLDLYSCALMAVVYSMKASSLYLSGTLGYWLCETKTATKMQFKYSTDANSCFFRCNTGSLSLMVYFIRFNCQAV